jgi:hypothetical protein
MTLRRGKKQMPVSLTVHLATRRTNNTEVEEV